MKKISIKQKKWNMHKSQKQMRDLSRQKKKSALGTRTKQHNAYQGKKQHKIYAPEVLSLVEDDGQKTLDFFGRAIETIQECKISESIYFEFKDIVRVTADAIMYVIALVNNYKRLNTLSIHVGGSLPTCVEAKSYFEDIGFYSYVKGLTETHPKNANRFRISRGEKPDSELVGRICDFVISSLGQTNSIILTKRLYPLIIEMMTNTCQHAYNDDFFSKMKRNWYVFAEKRDNVVHFVFLDTGEGIPATIQYKLIERGIKLFYRDDANYIASALRGENRTETKQSNRGKGLPGIYEDAKAGNVKNLSIISGRGRCDVLSNGEIKLNTLNYNFEGTLYEWDFKIS